MTTLREDQKIKIARFMGFPEPAVGQLWNYDRSLDHSAYTHNLEIASVKDGFVSFKQKMAYTRYGISYFNGVTFRPSNHAEAFWYPSRYYDSSWQDLMPVVLNIESMDYGFKICRKVVEVYIDSTKETIIHKKETSKIESLYQAVVEFIEYYNNKL